MAEGRQALRAHVAKLRSLGTLAETSAPAVVEAVRREIGRQVAQGQGPDGTPWAPTQAGERPLRRALKHVVVRALGTVVLVRLGGHYARHHLGAVRGKVRRPVIPTDRLPDPVTRAIRAVIEGRFHRLMGGDS